MTSLDLENDRADALALTPVSRETARRLDRFVELLLNWQRTTNLIGQATVPHLWTRHIADSLQLLDLAPDARVWIDVGSGAGFPGLVLACALTGQPQALVHLVESNNKKAAFLREAVTLTGAVAMVHAARMENIVDTFAGRVDAITARAVSPLSSLLGQCWPVLRRGSVGLFPKGQDVVSELTEASKYWTISADLVPSRTNPKARIVRVNALDRRATARS